MIDNLYILIHNDIQLIKYIKLFNVIYYNDKNININSNITS